MVGKVGDLPKGRAVRIRQHSNRPVLRKRLFCQTNLLQALPAGAIASPPFSAALLIGLKGVLSPKAQVQARRDVTL